MSAVCLKSMHLPLDASANEIQAAVGKVRQANLQLYGGVIYMKNESATQHTSRDFRYTAKGDRQLYAFFMQWPEGGRLNLRSLAKTDQSGSVIEKIELLGHEGDLEFTRGDKSLAVTLPDQQPCEHAWALRITGRNLRDFSPR